MPSRKPKTPAPPNLRGRGDCTPGAGLGGGDVALPIVEIDPATGMKRSRAGRWRAWSLAIVHLLIIGHVLHWLLTGKTLTPVEPSEAMETIRRGEINMGFLFFAAALIATLILGRWVCGWGCHLIAYQDLTLWILKKLHMRPKAFRSRFLVFVPLGAATYMFLYPLAARLWVAYHGRHVAPLTWHLSRTGFWDTFPGLLFSILSVLVCGIAIIYFLGPKGFCTFACPYGAFFGLSDKLAVARIRVTDACRQCGHCAAVCTSNVNVAEEVRLYRMVVDPGCMKCLDCVQTCPTGALYFGFGKPSLGAKPSEPRKARRYDMGLAAEFFALAIFGAFLTVVWGLYGSFPFLLSLGIAAILTYLVMKGVALFHSPNVMVQRLRLKVAGRIRTLGAAYGVGMLAVVGLTIHSGVWQYHNILADRAFAQSPPEVMNWQYDSRFTESISSEQEAQIAAGIRHYEACRGWGLVADLENDLSLAWLYVFTPDRQKAAGLLRTAMEDDPQQAGIWLMLAKVETFLGNLPQVGAAYERAIALTTADREAMAGKAGEVPHLLSSQVWVEWGLFLANQGELEAAEAALQDAIRFDPRSMRAHVALVDYQIATGNVDAARATLISASASAPHHPDVVGRLATLRMRRQDLSQAVGDYRDALEQNGDSVAILHNLAHALAELRQYDQAIANYREALELAPEALDVRAGFGAVLFIQENFEGAIDAYEYILDRMPANAEAAMRLAVVYYQVGRTKDAAEMLRLVVRHGDESQRQNARMLLGEITGSDVRDGRIIPPADPP